MGGGGDVRYPRLFRNGSRDIHRERGALSDCEFSFISFLTLFKIPFIDNTAEKVSLVGFTIFHIASLRVKYCFFCKFVRYIHSQI